MSAEAKPWGGWAAIRYAALLTLVVVFGVRKEMGDTRARAASMREAAEIKALLTWGQVR